eukprot:4300029-Karenia_brevis.AAC.1
MFCANAHPLVVENANETVVSPSYNRDRRSGCSHQALDELSKVNSSQLSKFCACLFQTQSCRPGAKMPSEGTD